MSSLHLVVTSPSLGFKLGLGLRFGMGRQMRWRMVLGVGELTLSSQSHTHESYVIGVMTEVIV